MLPRLRPWPTAATILGSAFADARILLTSRGISSSEDIASRRWFVIRAPRPKAEHRFHPSHKEQQKWLNPAARLQACSAKWLRDGEVSVRHSTEEHLPQ